MNLKLVRQVRILDELANYLSANGQFYWETINYAFTPHVCTEEHEQRKIRERKI